MEILILLSRVLCLFGLIALQGTGCAPSHRGPPQTNVSARFGRTQPQRPFSSIRAHPRDYTGPGRELPAPADLDEVRIGWFGPSDPGHPKAGAMWRAATLAVEEANQGGGYQGRPFRLVASWSDNPWGTGIKGITRLVYEQGAWAIVGAPDGSSAHLAEQVVAKARLTFINPVSTDKTANLANVPWIFSCAPGDHILAPPLAKALVRQADRGDVALVSCTDHDSRMLSAELLTALHKLHTFPTVHLKLRPDNDDFAGQLASLQDHAPAAVAVIAGPTDAARFVVALRREGLAQPVFGGPAMGHNLFADLAGQSAEDVVFPLLWHARAAGERSVKFAKRFIERFGPEPDYTAAYTYDAVNLLIATVRRAGLNRARIRDAAAELSPWPGVTGPITWDPTGQNIRPVELGTIHNGQVTPLLAG